MPANDDRPPLDFNTIAHYGNFDRVTSFPLSYANVTVSKWQSRKTGLSLVHLDYEAPLVEGYFVVASEIFDDTGRPHTLEHLVFLGSKKYPYKGVLDQLANRAFAEGTNAWTEQDHTAYTLSTAGSEGFLRLLPVYVDHILHPTLTASGFITEVYHIDPAGHDSGVVYSEMQGRQNTAGDLMALKMQRLINPPGIAYRSETAGLMEALRVLDIEQIREYHRNYYVPQNLMLIVAGKVDTEALLTTLQNEVEPSILEHRAGAGINVSEWSRPFIESTTSQRIPFSHSLEEDVQFPEQDESVGELLMAFSGPSPSDFLALEALDLLGTYLTSSATAPLNREFIEIEAPLCTQIYFDIESRVSCCDLGIFVGGVPAQHIASVHEEIRTALAKICSEGIDLERMSSVLERERRKFYNLVETSKGDSFSSNVIEDFLYGDRKIDSLQANLDVISRYDELATWSSGQWTAVLKRYFVDAPVVVVRGKPSASLAERLSTDETERVKRQIEDLGPHGLERVAKILQDAKSEQQTTIPRDIIRGFRIPDVRGISWIPVQSYRNVIGGLRLPQQNRGSALQQYILQDGRAVPFFVQFEHVESSFVSVHLLLSLSQVPEELLPYLSLYQSSFFSLPVMTHGGMDLSHAEVVDALDDMTVSYDTGLGFDGAFSQTVRLSLRVDTSKYEKAVFWLRDLLVGSQFDAERLKIIVAKMLQSFPEMKRDPDVVLESMSHDILFSPSSALRANSLLSQMEFLPTIESGLRSEPGRIERALEKLRKFLVRPEGIRFAITGNVLAINAPQTTLEKAFDISASSTDPIIYSESLLSNLGTSPTHKAFVVALSSVESSYAVHVARGPLRFGNPEWPALRVALEVLNGFESYLWKFIRGSGLGYSAGVGADLEAGHVSFSVYRSPNAATAFQEAARVVRSLSDGSMVLDDDLIDAAKSAIVFSAARQVSTSGRAALNSFINQEMKGIPADYHKQLLEKCQTAERSEILAAMTNYILPVFDPQRSVVFAVTSPGKADEISKSFEEIGFDVERRTMEVDESSDDETGSHATSSNEM